MLLTTFIRHELGTWQTEVCNNFLLTSIDYSVNFLIDNSKSSIDISIVIFGVDIESIAHIIYMLVANICSTGLAVVTTESVWTCSGMSCNFFLKNLWIISKETHYSIFIT